MLIVPPVYVHVSELHQLTDREGDHLFVGMRVKLDGIHDPPDRVDGIVRRP